MNWISDGKLKQHFSIVFESLRLVFIYNLFHEVENPKRWLFVDIFMSSFSCHNEPPAQFVWDAVRGETITSWNIESQLEILWSQSKATSTDNTSAICEREVSNPEQRRRKTVFFKNMPSYSQVIQINW